MSSRYTEYLFANALCNAGIAGYRAIRVSREYAGGPSQMTTSMSYHGELSMDRSQDLSGACTTWHRSARSSRSNCSDTWLAQSSSCSNEISRCVRGSRALATTKEETPLPNSIIVRQRLIRMSLIRQHTSPGLGAELVHGRASARSRFSNCSA